MKDQQLFSISVCFIAIYEVRSKKNFPALTLMKWRKDFYSNLKFVIQKNDSRANHTSESHPRFTFSKSNNKFQLRRKYPRYNSKDSNLQRFYRALPTMLTHLKIVKFQNFQNNFQTKKKPTLQRQTVQSR